MIKQVMIALAFATVLVQSELSEEHRQKLAEISKKCMEEVGVDHSALHEIEKGGPKERKIGCFMGCLYSEMGYIKNEKINTDFVMEHGKENGISEEDIEKMKVIVEECDKEVGTISDICELGPKAVDCIKPKIKAAGIKH